MKTGSLAALLGILVLGVNALPPERQVLITYPSDTPDSIVGESRSAIEAAGGHILHDFKLFKGFIAKATAQILDSVHTLSDGFKPLIEDDQTVTIQEEKS